MCTCVCGCMWCVCCGVCARRVRPVSANGRTGDWFSSFPGGCCMEPLGCPCLGVPLSSSHLCPRPCVHGSRSPGPPAPWGALQAGFHAPRGGLLPSDSPPGFSRVGASRGYGNQHGCLRKWPPRPRGPRRFPVGTGWVPEQELRGPARGQQGAGDVRRCPPASRNPCPGSPDGVGFRVSVSEES